MGVVPTIAFKNTTQVSGMNFGSSSGSTSSPNFLEKMAAMESKVQALCDYIITMEGGRMPKELASVFHNPTPQTTDVGSGAASPNDLRRSSDRSNTHELADLPSPHCICC